MNVSQQILSFSQEMDTNKTQKVIKDLKDLKGLFSLH